MSSRDIINPVLHHQPEPLFQNLLIRTKIIVGIFFPRRLLPFHFTFPGLRIAPNRRTPRRMPSAPTTFIGLSSKCLLSVCYVPDICYLIHSSQEMNEILIILPILERRIWGLQQKKEILPSFCFSGGRNQAQQLRAWCVTTVPKAASGHDPFPRPTSGQPLL